MEIQKTALRLPKHLHSQVVESAKESGRSMNAEIVYQLERAYKKQDSNWATVKLSQEAMDAIIEMAAVMKSDNAK